jgi:hypothetical protein
MVVNVMVIATVVAVTVITATVGIMTEDIVVVFIVTVVIVNRFIVIMEMVNFRIMYPVTLEQFVTFISRDDALRRPKALHYDLPHLDIRLGKIHSIYLDHKDFLLSCDRVRPFSSLAPQFIFHANCKKENTASLRSLNFSCIRSKCLAF